MNINSLAYKRIRNNLNHYVHYLGSMVFTVMVFFLYLTLVDHPQLATDFQMASKVKVAINASAIIITLFTFVFLLFASAAFLRSRQKEFGILSLLGMSKRQLAKLVIAESVIVGILALSIGIGLGILLQKLFLMTVSAILKLDNQLGFYLSLQTIYTTIYIFGTLFWVVAILSLREVVLTSVADLLKAGKKPKGLLRYSRFKAFFGVFLIVSGYLLALLPYPNLIPLLVLPVVVITCLGTFLFLKETSLAILTTLRKKTFYFSKVDHFLNISQLSYKMKDNYRTMSSVAILVAVILTALSTIYTVYQVIEKRVLDGYPHHFELSGKNPYLTIPSFWLETILADEGIEATKTEITGLITDIDTKVIFKGANIDRTRVVVLPYSYYQMTKDRHYELKDNEALLLNYYYYNKPDLKGASYTSDTIIIGEQEFFLGKIFKEDGETLLNKSPNIYPQLFVNDKLFREMRTIAKETCTYIFWQTEKWKTPLAANAARKIVAKLDSLASKYARSIIITTSPEKYEESRITSGLGLFIGFFVTLIFFAACCSLLYFRLFMDLDEDRKYYKRLIELGVPPRQMYISIMKQVLVIFMVPYLLAISHSFFALGALSTLAAEQALRSRARGIVLSQGLVIAVLYFLLYSLYFFGAFNVYWRKLNKKQTS